MRIKVFTFASIRDICGFEEKEMILPEKCSVNDVIQKLIKGSKDFVKIKDNILFALNEEYCDEDSLLNEGDNLAIFPPVSGG